MKKIYKLSIFLVALTLASSCVQDEGGLNPPEPQTVTITAGAASTKTLLDAGAVKWEDGDAIDLVFYSDNGASIHEFTTSVLSASATADFTGQLPVGMDSDYQDQAYAVYPSGALGEDGKVKFSLPLEQRVRADGTFARGLNLASASVSLPDILEDGKASASFLNALSIIRFKVADDVTSVTLTGTSPLAGAAPLAFDSDGRLAVQSDSWESSSCTVTVLPAEGSECFAAGEVNLLVWPGAHTEMSVTVNFKEFGELHKTSTTSFKFEPAKYYTFNLNADSDELVSELLGGLTDLESSLNGLEDSLEGVEADAARLSRLLSQIQSVALLTEYLDNEVYATYANLSTSRLKHEIELDYVIRPASVAQQLIEDYSDVLKAQVCYRKSGGLEFTTLPVSSVELNGDVMSVKVNADGLDDAVYTGTYKAELALSISDGNTEILSDFAKLVPKVASALKVNYTTDIPVVVGATVSIPFSYAVVSGSSKTFSYSGTNCDVTLTDQGGTGYLKVTISSDYPVSEQKAILTLQTDSDTVTKEFTFVDGGSFEVTSNGDLDYIGGEVSLSVVSSFSNWSAVIKSGGAWLTSIGTSDGKLIYSASANDSDARGAGIEFTVTNAGLKYIKTFTVQQRAVNTTLQRKYYSNGNYVMLNTASASGLVKPLNVVILGDGYQQKDLAEGGKFERSARSAMSSFFGVEPFASFMDRFNVYMLAYESEDEGVDVTASSIDVNTYFGATCTGGGNTAVSCDWAKVQSAVETMELTTSNYDLYRTVAILLMNTDETSGSCNYLDKGSIDESCVGDGIKEFSIAAVAANTSTVGGLIRHEAGGHGFGRLGDEYNTGSASRTNASLDENHNLRFYLNLSYTIGSSCPWYDLIGYDGTDCYEGAWGCSTGYYRPSETSIMLNNQGKFNAPSRQIIYERIIRQTEGASAYSLDKFKEYDKKNL